MIKLHLAIVDDNQSLAKTLRQELQAFPELDLITTSSSGLDYVKELKKPGLRIPDVVLMDISMQLPDEGILATRMLLEQYPEMKVVMFTVAENDERIFEAFKAGAVGYLLKNERPVFIYKTIMDAYYGGAQMSPSIALKTIQFLQNPPAAKDKTELQPASVLSDRELEVLRSMAKGLTYMAISEQLFISVETVKKHMTNIFKKLHVSNKIEALNKTRQYL